MHGRGSVEIALSVVDDLDWAAVELEIVNGALVSRWERTDGGLPSDAEVPWTTDTAVQIPVDDILA